MAKDEMDCPSSMDRGGAQFVTCIIAGWNE